MGVNGASSSGPRRSSYPSGPWIDGIHPYESTCSSSLPSGNPDPSNYKLLLAEEHSNFLIIKLQYPNCTNFEGVKILVFRDVKLIDLINQKLIDPHFFQDKRYASPIARFVPTDEGLDMARKFADSLS